MRVDLDESSGLADWSGPVPCPTFAMIPDAMLNVVLAMLSGSDFKVFYCLVHIGFGIEHSDTVAISTRDLASRCAMAPRTARLSLQALVRSGLLDNVEMHEPDWNKPNRYRINLTRDSRYIRRVQWGSNDPRGGGSNDPRGGDQMIPPRHFGPSIYKNQSSTERAHADKYFAGQYAACRACGSRPCSCGG